MRRAINLREKFGMFSEQWKPKVIAEITNEIHYGNDNRAADAFIDPQILHDPTIYPTPEVEARLYHSSEVAPPLERIRTRTWTRVKTAL